MTSIDYAALAREMREKQRSSSSTNDETLQKRNSDHPKDLMQGGGISELKHDEEAIMIHPRNQPIALPSSLNSSRLGNTGAAYVANFLSTEEEQKLMREIYSCSSKWVQLSARRLQNWGGVVKASGMHEEKLPEWLLSLQPKLSSMFPSPFNHVLINEYLPGQGIFAHEDGPLYYPVVAIVSLNSGLLIEFEKKRQASTSATVEKVMSVYLQPRSLFVFAEELYTQHLHVIEPRKSDLIDDKCINATQASIQVGSELQRDTRVSLTIRLVPKVIRKKVGGVK